MFYLILLVIFLTLKNWGIGWVKTWWLTLGVVIISGVVALGAWASDDMEAGADWFKYGKSWVETYELAEINLKKAWGSDNLDLKDVDGREISIKITEIQNNVELWNLVYNGILHSVHYGGAVVNERARAKLRIDERLNEVSEGDQR